MPSTQNTAASTSAIKPSVSQLFAPLSFPRAPTDYLALVNSRWQKIAAGGKRLPARLTAVYNETTDSRTLEIKPGFGWRGHRAGQFINVHVNINGVWHSRCYSITSSDRRRRGRLRITVRAIADGLVSNYLVHSATAGERLHISQAQGEFVLPNAKERGATPHPTRLFITAGSGITPVMGMLNSGATATDCVHIHYERHAKKVVFSAPLHELASRDGHYRRNEIHTSTGGAHFSPNQLDELCPDWRERDVWACGPAPLIEAVEDHWGQAGLAERLQTERFQAPQISVADDAQGGDACFSASGVRSQAAADESLLEVAERAGLKPAHGCRMGICHSCDCALVSGAVRDLRNGRITTAGVHIQPCISATVGDIELDL